MSVPRQPGKTVPVSNVWNWKNLPITRQKVPEQHRLAAFGSSETGDEVLTATFNPSQSADVQAFAPFGWNEAPHQMLTARFGWKKVPHRMPFAPL